MFSVRALEESTGISKSEVSGSLRRCMDVGLAKPERGSGLPRANTRALLGFIMNGIKFVFPARPGPLVRGIPTAHAAPVLAGRLLSAGEHIYVWEDAYGNVQGQRVRSEEHTSELQSLIRNAYAVFCLKKKNRNNK